MDQISDKAGIIKAFFTFAQAEQQREAGKLIREFASDNGAELNEIFPKMSPLNPQYLPKKQSVFQKISAFVEKIKGVRGEL